MILIRRKKNERKQYFSTPASLKFAGVKITYPSNRCAPSGVEGLYTGNDIVDMLSDQAIVKLVHNDISAGSAHRLALFL